MIIESNYKKWYLWRFCDLFNSKLLYNIIRNIVLLDFYRYCVYEKCKILK